MNPRAPALAAAVTAPRSGSLGLSVQLWWGDERVGEYFLRPGQARSFSVGSAEGVDFAMGHALLGASRFDVLRSDPDGFVLRFNRRMEGALARGGVETPLAEIDGAGEEVSEVVLEPGDRAQVNLGGIRLEAAFARVPRLPPTPLAEAVDFTVLNAFLACLFLGSLALITAVTQETGLANVDDLGANAATLRKVMVRAAPPVVVKPLVAAQGRRDPEQAAAAHSGREGRAGSPTAPERPARAANRGRATADTGRELVHRLFGGRDSIANAVTGLPGLGGELEAAVGHLRGPVAGAARGVWGMGLEGDGPGGGGPKDSAMIGTDLHTRGKGNDPGYGLGPGHLPPGQPPPPVPDFNSIVRGCGEGTPCLDKDLIRRVIHRNRSQLRYCYELALTRNPSLTGKVSVAFTIAAHGAVTEAGVAASDLRDPAMESCVVSRLRGWVFPSVPAGWVKVTYPFVFHPAGE